MKKLIVLVTVFGLTTSRLFSFGGEGHRTIATIAQSQLSDKTKGAIEAILDGESMVDAAMWPDDIKQPMGKLWKTTEARLFTFAHPDHKKWHYVNFPVGATRYTTTNPFAYPHDIVHVINGCITVLEGGTFEKLNPKEALRYLLHLVGDIHQPLHLVAGYYDLSDPARPKLETNPLDIDRDSSDGGGNSLSYTATSGMHTYWDTVLVDAVFSTKDPVVLAGKVMEGASPSDFMTTGKHYTWAAKWAGDSMKIAKLAYADIEFGAATLTQHGELKSMAVTLKPSTSEYRAKFTPLAKEQLRKAGLHLGQLLNSILWAVDT